MTPWRSRRFLRGVADYENYEFYSKGVGVGDESKIKWLEFDVAEGHLLYIPPWWWYSFRFSSVDTRVIGVEYNTFANILAHVPDLARYYFQYHMTKRVTTRTLDMTGSKEGLTEGPIESIESTSI
jgi:hypothetical protein